MRFSHSHLLVIYHLTHFSSHSCSRRAPKNLLSVAKLEKTQIIDPYPNSYSIILTRSDRTA